MQSIEITTPDDWHHHFRDDDRLRSVAPFVARQFARAIAMPNLKPPVTTTEQAVAYKQRILQACQKTTHITQPNTPFDPLMTLYLTDKTTPEEIGKAAASGIVKACKLYPAGATTNSDSGVTDIPKMRPVFEKMAETGILLLVHSEVTDQSVDIFDREKAFIDRHLRPLIAQVPSLKVVMEHITTADAVHFVTESGPNLAATITCHHLLYNRNAIFKGGLNPHMYCLPVLKREKHRLALLDAIRSGSPRFFLGTDSAPHTKGSKESSCGCAGVFTAHAALELYAEAFDKAGCLDNLEAFASFNGPDFYGLPRNTSKVRLEKKPTPVPPSFPFVDSDPADPEDRLVPLRSNETVEWSLVGTQAKLS